MKWWKDGQITSIYDRAISDEPKKKKTMSYKETMKQAGF